MSTHTLDLALALFVNVRPHWWFKAVTFNSPGSSMNNESPLLLLSLDASHIYWSLTRWCVLLISPCGLMALVEWQHAVTHVCAEYLPSDLIRSICSSQKEKKKEKCTWSSLRKPTRIFCARCELLFSGEQVSEWAPLSNIRPRSGRYLCSSSHRLTRCLYNLLFPPPLLWLDACHQLPTWTKPGRGKRAAGSACHIPVQALTLFLHGDLSRL